LATKKIKGLIGEEKVKCCPLWSIFYGTDKKECLKEECGLWGLCNPFAAEQKEKAKEEDQELKTFGGGHAKQKDKD